MSIGFILLIVLICAAIFVSAWTDAPNVITTIVTTRVLNPTEAITLAAVFTFIGVVLSGTAVAATTGSLLEGISEEVGLLAIAACLLALILWSLAAWWNGLPTSKTHALVSGMAGAGLALGGKTSLNEDSYRLVLYGLFISTFIGLALAYVFTLAVKYFAMRQETERRKANRFFSGGQILSGILLAYSHGAQGGQKYSGLLYMTLVFGGIVAKPATPDWELPLTVLMFTALFMTLGTSVGGYRIVKHIGMEMLQLKKYQGFGADLAASLSLIGATQLGIPLSTTMTKACAMMGAAAERGRRGIRFKVAHKLLLAWVLTFPACLVLGFGFAKLLQLIT